MKRILLKGLLVVLCIAIFGCAVDEDGNAIGSDESKAKYKWGKWSDIRLISIMDDSLAVLAMYRDYYKEWIVACFDGCLIDRKTADSRIGLFLVNYREKQKPIWGDTLNLHSRIVRGYLKDNSVLVFDRKYNKFGFWKIGTNTIEFMDYSSNYNEIQNEIQNEMYVNINARPWTNGNILLFYKDYFSYSEFLLETENRQLKQFEFSGEYEWLSKCANYWFREEPVIEHINISSIGGKASCIKKNEITNNFELTVDNVVTDSLSSLKWYRGISGWYGNYIVDNSGENRVYKIDTLNFKFDSTYIPIRLYGEGYSPEFYKNIEDNPIVINYSKQDLFEAFE